ncbi:hypothetical protein [Chitinilyticum aquatile]|uniref:hypothetical protein n=1 Tax=Chitinilyticum aquatile TaxID=362520 RepID=UPI00040A3943|nr:hypothetical protein [Chitinilyticum aquatile]
MPAPTPVAIDLALQEIRASLPQDLAPALARARKAHDEARSLGYAGGVADALIVCALVQWEQMAYRDGLRDAEAALQLIRDERLDDYLAEAWHAQALNYWGLARYSSALQGWLNALELALLTQQHAIALEALIGMGNVWRTGQELERAERVHRQASLYAETASLPVLAGKASILHAWDCYLLKHYERALDALDAASVWLQDCANPTWHAEIHDFRGLVYLELGELALARSESTAAHELAIAHKQIWMIAHSAISLARIANRLGEYALARELLCKAEAEAAHFDQGELLARICLERCALEERDEHPDAALLYYRRYRQYELHQLRQHYAEQRRQHGAQQLAQLNRRADQLLQRLEQTQGLSSRGDVSGMRRREQWLQALQRVCRQQESQTALLMLDCPEAAVPVVRQLVLASLGKSDLPVQYTPGQLGVLLFGLDETGLQCFCNDIVRMLAAYPWWRQGCAGSTGVRLGASVIRPGDEARAVLARATPQVIAEDRP